MIQRGLRYPCSLQKLSSKIPLIIKTLVVGKSHFKALFMVAYEAKILKIIFLRWKKHMHKNSTKSTFFCMTHFSYLPESTQSGRPKHAWLVFGCTLQFQNGLWPRRLLIKMVSCCAFGAAEKGLENAAALGAAVLQRGRAPPPSVFVLWMDNTLQRFVLEQMCPQDIKYTAWCAGPKWLTIEGETVHFTFFTASLSTRNFNHKFKIRHSVLHLLNTGNKEQTLKGQLWLFLKIVRKIQLFSYFQPKFHHSVVFLDSTVEQERPCSRLSLPLKHRKTTSPCRVNVTVLNTEQGGSCALRSSPWRWNQCDSALVLIWRRCK